MGKARDEHACRRASRLLLTHTAGTTGLQGWGVRGARCRTGVTAADLGRDKDVGAGNSQQVQQLHGGVRGTETSAGQSEAGWPAHLITPLGRASEAEGLHAREPNSLAVNVGLFFSFLTEKGSGAQTPGLEAYRKDITLGCTRRSLLTPPGCEAACSSGGTAVTKTATL